MATIYLKKNEIKNAIKENLGLNVNDVIITETEFTTLYTVLYDNDKKTSFFTTQLSRKNKSKTIDVADMIGQVKYNMK